MPGVFMLPGVSLDSGDQSLMYYEVRVILRQDPGHTSSPGALHQTTTRPIVFIQLSGIIFFHRLVPSQAFLIVEIVALKTYQVNRF